MLTLALGLGLAVGLQAQTWSYSDCVDYARDHNITLQKTRLSELSTQYSLEESKAQWQPSLDFATTHGVTNQPWGVGDKTAYNSSYGFNASWNVWNGGVRENNIKRNRIQLEIDRLNTTETFRSIETDLLQVYLNILYAKESISIYEEASKLSLAQAERGKALMEAGKISKVDYARLNSQYEQDRYSLVNARGTYDTRRMELKQILELGIDADITLADVEWTAQQILASLPPIEQSYQMALATDAQLRGLEKEMEVADVDVDIAKAGRLPNISLNAGVGTGYYAPGSAFGTSLKRALNESLGLTVSVPILDQKKTKTAVAQAKVQQLNTQLDIDKRSNDLAQAVENWYIDTQSAQARYVAAQQQLESAKLTNELTNEQFNLGYVNTVELMSAHNGYTEAQHTLLQSKFMAILGRKMVDFYRDGTVSL